MDHPYLEIDEIRESADGAQVRLRVSGELDLDSARVLKQRLDRLRDEHRRVRLDLSELTFIGAGGIHLLIEATREAEDDGWGFALDDHLQPQVERVLRLIDGDLTLLRRPAEAPRPQARPARVRGPEAPARRSWGPALSP